LANKLAWNNIMSVASMSAKQMHQLCEKHFKNQQPDNASIAEAQQQRPIPLLGTERIC
jgi:hypothetical protein